MTDKKYILNGKELVEVDLMIWAKWIEEAKNRQVALDKVGKKTISTVFLGIDHNLGAGEPHLFETMIFPGGELFERYPTWEKAEEGHKKALANLHRNSPVASRES